MALTLSFAALSLLAFVIASADDTCRGSGDLIPGTYHGSVSIDIPYPANEYLRISLKSYVDGAGIVDFAGGGRFLNNFVCADKGIAKIGNDNYLVDTTDCLPDGMALQHIQYCSDTDTIQLKIYIPEATTTTTTTNDETTTASWITTLASVASTTGVLYVEDSGVLITLTRVSPTRSHYGQPPCLADENVLELNFFGVMCLPSCDSLCPADIHAGISLMPQCDTDIGGCVLKCSDARDCPPEGACVTARPHMLAPRQICVWPTPAAYV